MRKNHLEKAMTLKGKNGVHSKPLPFPDDEDDVAVEEELDEEEGALSEEESESLATTFKIPKGERLKVREYSRDEAMSLVRMFVSLQKLRIVANHREKARERGVALVLDPVLVADKAEPYMVKLMKEEMLRIEKEAAKCLYAYAEGQPLGQWCLSIPGMGGILTSALLTYVNFDLCCCPGYKGMPQHTRPKHRCNGLPSAGHIWSFVGYSDKKWEKKQKRPYCAFLKTICWKIGEQFRRAPGQSRNGKQLREFTLYERLYRERKVLEVERNEAGELAKQAHERLETALANHWRISPLQKKIWGSGKLQPKGLELRAKRYAVKIFLSHFFQVGKEIRTGKCIEPWVLAHRQHTHYIPPPNWPMEE